MIGFDTETTVVPRGHVADLVCLSYSYPDGRKGVLDASEGLVWFSTRLAAGESLVAHNLPFDASVLIKAGADHKAVADAIRTGKLTDTGVYAKLNAIRYGWLDYDPYTGKPAAFSLEALAEKYLNVTVAGKKDEPDSWRMRYGELRNMPIADWPQGAIDYAQYDAVLVREIYERLEHYPVCTDLIFQVEAQYWLYLAGLWGAATDSAKVDTLEQTLVPIVSAIKEELAQEGIYERKPTKVFKDDIETEVKRALEEQTIYTAGGKVSLATAQLRKALSASGSFVLNAFINKDIDTLIDLGFAEEGGWKLNRREVQRRLFDEFGFEYLTDKGKEHLVDGTPLELAHVSSDREALMESSDPALASLASIGAHEKILTTYVPAFREADIVHPRWNGLVATGRVSVSRPNLNNIPKLGPVRTCIRARDGYTLISADYVQAELCALAQACLDLFGWSNMADAIRAGRDLHIVTATEILRVKWEQPDLTYEDVYAKFELGNEEVIATRALAKVTNFGKPGGQGAESFRKFAKKAGVSITLDESADLGDRWMAAYPEMRLYFKHINGLIEDAGGDKFSYVQHRTGRVRGGLGYCDGCNTVFQGLTADGAKNAMNRICREMYLEPGAPLFGTRLVAFIYDEFLVEVPLGIDTAAVAGRLHAHMVEGMKELTPDIPVSVELAMMYNWNKKAKAVYDAGGQLVPWDEPPSPVVGLFDFIKDEAVSCPLLEGVVP